MQRHFCPTGLRATPARWQETISTCSSSSARRGSHMSWRLFLLLSPQAPPALHSEYCSPQPTRQCVISYEMNTGAKKEDGKVFLLFLLNFPLSFIPDWARAARMGKTPWVTSVVGRLFSTSSPRSTSPSGQTTTSVRHGPTSSAESQVSTGSVYCSTADSYFPV